METASPTPEDLLVAQIKSQDVGAFSKLYDNYSAALYGVILRIVRSDELAQDVLQDSFVKIWKNFPSYDASKGKLFTWMLNVARNSALDAIKSKAFRMSSEIRNLDNSVNEINHRTSVNLEIDHIGLKEAMAQLKPEYRELLDLAFFGGYTHDEMSKELNMPLGTVKTRIRAAVNHLRTFLKV